ncbi:MAG: phosphotransferase family protein [Sphingomonadaceae bacterium]
MDIPADIEGVIDLAALEAWMDGESLGCGRIDDLRLLPGGTQNILLRFRRGGDEYVLRRPPSHPRAGNNETMMREARVLAALAHSDVPHPRLIAACADEAVIGAAFYLMEPVEGFNAVNGLPSSHADDPAVRHAMGMAIVDAATALGAVDHVAVGLADFGRTDHFLERQVPRWRKQLESYVGFAGWPGDSGIPGVDRISEWLERWRPAGFMPGIMHGDFHLANVMYRPDGPGIAAVVDWELATIGDPLLDLGWLLATWADPDGSNGIVSATPWAGFPGRDELIARYRERSERDLDAVQWYAVLACFKLGILLEGSYARACAGKADRASGERLHGLCISLFDRALRWIP